MPLDTIVKAKVSIGPATHCDTEAEFKALSGWKQIKNCDDVGEFSGDKPVAVGRFVDADHVRKLAGGARDAGKIAMVFSYDATDEGQIALKAAYLADAAYAIKIELPDAPVGGTPTTWFFMAIIGPVDQKFGDGSELIKLNAVFDIDGAVIEVAAAEAP